MPNPEENESLADRFGKILSSAKAFLGEDVLGAFVRKPADRPFIDIDRVWHTGSHIDEVVDLLVQAFSEWGLDDLTHYDTIVAASSSIASYGAIPLASGVAARLKKNLCILSQAANGTYALYPSTLSYQDLLSDKDVLLLHDAIVYGHSVARVAQHIADMSGRVRVLVVLVDQEPLDRMRLPHQLEGVPLFALTTGPKLAALTGGE